MQDKKINPLGDDVVRSGSGDFLKVAHFTEVERSAACNRSVTNIRDYAVYYDDFGSGFTTLNFAMYMDWLMFIGVEHDN